MKAIHSAGKMRAAALGIIAMALCFAWGARAQDPADVDDPAVVDVDDPADSTDLADADDPADSTGAADSTDLADADVPADSTDLADADVPADSTDLADADVPADSTDLADVDVPADSTDLVDSGGTDDTDEPPVATVPVITITKQPVAAITLMKGQSDTLTVEASVTKGATLSYQWYYANADSVCAGEDAGCEEEDESMAVLYGATGPSIVFSADDFEVGTHVFYCVVSATGGAVSVRSGDAVVTVEAANISVASANRDIPSYNSGGAAAVSPVTALTAEFAAGPNPVARQSGGVSFFWSGKAVGGATLYVYDAAGKVVRKIGVRDNSAVSFGKRSVGVWNLRDSKGRMVSEGSYVVKGAISTKDGKREKVSLILGIK
jgi:hypothetical protein